MTGSTVELAPRPLHGAATWSPGEFNGIIHEPSRLYDDDWMVTDKLTIVDHKQHVVVAIAGARHVNTCNCARPLGLMVQTTNNSEETVASPGAARRHIHEITRKAQTFLHQYNKLALSQLKRMCGICGWSRKKRVMFTSSLYEWTLELYVNRNCETGVMRQLQGGGACAPVLHSWRHQRGTGNGFSLGPGTRSRRKVIFYWDVSRLVSCSKLYS